jgi:1-acyl-sn-glycerol-3-phosphate acyltransferase
MFDTPGLSVPLRWLAWGLMKIFGWRMEGEVPGFPKYVLIAAPHTSNWDLAVMLTLAFNFRTRISWMGKDALFRWPFGGLCRWLGGIPIDRSRSHNVVEQSVALFREKEAFVLVVPPEGTRKKVRYWKTGFYYIARDAGVPILLGFIDYGRKKGGFGPVVMPTGDIEADMKTIQSFYAGITGKNPEQTDRADVRKADNSKPVGRDS